MKFSLEKKRIEALNQQIEVQAKIQITGRSREAKTLQRNLKQLESILKWLEDTQERAEAIHAILPGVMENIHLLLTFWHEAKAELRGVRFVVFGGPIVFGGPMEVMGIYGERWPKLLDGLVANAEDVSHADHISIMTLMEAQRPNVSN